ncbi:hypothetical protein YB2330_003384 [Saitoella coloradoensis]
MNEIFKDTVKGATVLGLAGGSVSATYAVLKNQPVGHGAIANGLSLAVTGGLFYGIRQAVLTGITGMHSRLVTDKDRVVASGVSGAISGAILNAVYYKQARPAVIAAFVFGLYGTTGQFVVNYGQSLRRSYLLRQKIEAGEVEPELANVLPQQEKKLWSNSPIRQISLEDHGAILKDKLVNTDIQIAQVDAELEHIMKHEENRK